MEIVLQELNLENVSKEWADKIFRTGGHCIDKEKISSALAQDAFSVPSSSTLLKLKRTLGHLHKQEMEEEKSVLWEELLKIERNTVQKVPIHRSLLTMLVVIMGNEEGNMETKTNAILAASCYLTWIQFHGCASYGIFSKALYKMALSLIQSSIEVLRVNHNTQRTNLWDRFVQSLLQYIDLVFQVVKYCKLVLDCDPLIASIEVLVYLNGMAPSWKGWIQEKHLEIVVYGTEQALIDVVLLDHSKSVQVLGLIFRQLLPSLMNANMSGGDKVEKWNTVKYRKGAQQRILLMIGKLQRAVHCAELEQETVECLRKTYVALLQGACMNAPEKAEPRASLVNVITELVAEKNMDSEMMTLFVVFLSQYATYAKDYFRMLAVQLASSILSANDNADQKMPKIQLSTENANVLVQLLYARCNDQISTVRAKAIQGISKVLQLNATKESALACIIQNQDQTENIEASAMCTYASLLKMFRYRLSDDKVLVRKAAIQGLEIMLEVDSGDTECSDFDILSLKKCCTDESVMIRSQAISLITALLLKYPSSSKMAQLWNASVLPLAMDVESTVQKKCYEAIRVAIFQRLVQPDKLSNAESALTGVWEQIAQIGVTLYGCMQRALANLLANEEVPGFDLIKSLHIAVLRCSEEQKTLDSKNSGCWAFAWCTFETLCTEGIVLKAIKTRKVDISFVVTIWKQSWTASFDADLLYYYGCQKLLSVLAMLASHFDADDVAGIAETLFHGLQEVQVRKELIPTTVNALRQLCMAKAPSDEAGLEIASTCFSQLFQQCETELSSIFVSGSDSCTGKENISRLERQIVLMGELSALNFSVNDEKNVLHFDIEATEQDVTLIQSLMAKTYSPFNEMGDTDSSSFEIPACIRIAAFVALGKMCLMNERAAKNCISIFVREMQVSTNSIIRSNALMILGDFCIRYTSVVELYVPAMGSCVLDDFVCVRRNALALLSQLILQDYVKWKIELLKYFLVALIDKDASVRALAKYLLGTPLQRKAPRFFATIFVEIVFLLSKGWKKSNEVYKVNETQRLEIYTFLLSLMADEDRLQVSGKLVSDILEGIIDEKYSLKGRGHGLYMNEILADVFNVLMCDECAISLPNDGNTEKNDDAEAENPITQAKGKLLAKLSAKNFMENVIPTIISLKSKLQDRKHAGMRYVMRYLQHLHQSKRCNLMEVLSADPLLAREIEYDLKTFRDIDSDRRQSVLVEQEVPSRTPKKAMKTPLKKLIQSSTHQTPKLKNRNHESSKHRNSVPRLENEKWTPSIRTPYHRGMQTDYICRKVDNLKSKTSNVIPVMLFSPLRTPMGLSKTTTDENTPPSINTSQASESPHLKKTRRQKNR